MNLIKKLRKEHRMTQGDFGHLFGVTGSHISKIEKGQSYPHDRLVEEIADRFNISPEQIKQSLYTGDTVDLSATQSYKLRYEVVRNERDELQQQLTLLKQQHELLEQKVANLKEALQHQH